MAERIDLTGNRYGRLVVIEYAFSKRYARSTTPQWRCVCDCGRETVVAGSNLKVGGTQSCGCLRSEVSTRLRTKHGQSNSPEHRSWMAMRNRVQQAGANPELAHAPYYAHVSIDPSWLGSDGFSQFLTDMGKKPTPRHSIDRINPQGDYEPGNCRWATPSEQTRSSWDSRRRRLETRN